MKVHEAMAHTISTGAPSDPLKRIAQLMKQEDAGFIPICEGDRLLGVVTDRDIIVRCLAEHEDVLNVTAEHCMSKEVATIDAEADIEEAARTMEQREVRRLPVMKDGKLAGIISHGNLVQAMRSDGPADTATLGVTRGA